MSDFPNPAIRVYLTSAEGKSGKSTVAVGLVDALVQSGVVVGIFSPILRSSSEPDPMLDVLLDHANANIDPESCRGVDAELFRSARDDSIRIIVDKVAALEKQCDWLIILGSNYTGIDAPTELADNTRLAADLGATVVLVAGGRDVDGLERTPTAIAEFARVALAELRSGHATPSAIVVTRCSPENLHSVADQLRTSTGLPAWAIAEDTALMAPLLRSVIDELGGTLIRGTNADLERPVLGTALGAMSLENLLPRLSEDGLVVVPGDRSEVLLGALAAHASHTAPSLAGVIVNGGFPIAPAIERVIDGLGDVPPIATCDLDTYETAVRITRTRSLLAADSPAKYERARALFRRYVPSDELLTVLRAAPASAVTPARFEHALAERARGRRMRIVLPEGDDDRILRAASIVAEQGIADVILLGDPANVDARAISLGVDLRRVQIVSPADPKLRAQFAEKYTALRAHKGVTREDAERVMGDVSYFGTMMVHLGLADGMVSGAGHTTANTIRPAFEFVKTAPGVSVVSSVFLMALADRVLVYGDCAIIPEPTTEQLADIALSAAATARRFGIEPRVAMLSYSTADSGSGGDVKNVRDATALVRERAPELPVLGPVQYDAAADPAVAATKLPNSAVAGHATVFVFPDLDAGNTTYKAVQRSANALAIGPILQGLAKPINDLSRGATVRDIVNTIAITAIQAQEDE